jgi:hypothetical protein
MTAAMLLANLEIDGFRVRAERGKLLVQPAERLTPEMVAELQANKSGLLEVLAQRAVDSPSPQPLRVFQPPPPEPEREFPDVRPGNLPAGTLSPVADVLRLIERASVVAFDLETTGLNPRTAPPAAAVRLGRQAGAGARPVGLRPGDPVWQALACKTLVAHNAAFDLGFLWHAGVRDLPRTVCTFLLAELLHAGTATAARAAWRRAASNT